MKLCRFQPRIISADKIGATAHPEGLQGVISGDTVREISGDMLARWSVTNRSRPLRPPAGVEAPPAGPAEQDRLSRQELCRTRRRIQQSHAKQPLIFLKPPS